MIKNIGIFAGSFDPIHDGHIEMAKSALHNIDLDKLYFMVEEKSWSRKKAVSKEHRENMVKVATKSQDKLDILSLEDEKFSIEHTLPKLEKRFRGNNLFFILGSDVFIKMSEETWPTIENLTKHYLVVFERKSVNEREISEHNKSLGFMLAILPSPMPDHSSTDVRLDLENRHLWLPKEVEEYIKNNNLYS